MSKTTTPDPSLLSEDFLREGRRRLSEMLAGYDLPEVNSDNLEHARDHLCMARACSPSADPLADELLLIVQRETARRSLDAALKALAEGGAVYKSWEPPAPEPSSPASSPLAPGSRIVIREHNNNRSDPGLAVRVEHEGVYIETDREMEVESIGVEPADLPRLIAVLSSCLPSLTVASPPAPAPHVARFLAGGKES